MPQWYNFLQLPYVHDAWMTWGDPVSGGNMYSNPEGRKRLPKFKFSVKFPIGLHVYFTNTDKKIRKWLLSYVKNYFNRKSVEVQRWTPLEIMLNGFCLKIVYGNTYAVHVTVAYRAS